MVFKCNPFFVGGSFKFTVFDLRMKSKEES